MEFSDRIIYSQEQMMLDLQNNLDKLNVFRYDAGYKQILGESFVDKLNGWVRNIQNQKNNPFTLVVTGDFKRGKSTFINALLGEEVCPTDVTTETVTLNKISYGAHSNEAVLSGSRRVRLSDNELKRENLETLIRQAGEPITQIEIKRDNPLLKKITIIDTPGIGDSMKDFSSAVKDSLLQADAVIYVYNAQYPLSMTEQLFLKSAVLPQKYTSLFLVGNFADTLNNEKNLERMRELLSGRLSGLIPNAQILLLSALDEMCRITGEERPERRLESILQKEFDTFRNMLDRAIEEKADAVVLDRMQRLTSAMVAELNAELNALESGLSMDADAAAAALRQLTEQKTDCVKMQESVLKQIDDQVDNMKTEANVWLREFLGDIEKESMNLHNVPYEVLLKHYECYCVDLLQQAVNTCVEFHQEEMFETMEGISASLSEKFALGLDEKQRYGFRINLDNRIWTKGDTVGFAVNYAANIIPLLGIGSLVVDAITGVMRDKEARKSTPDIMKQIASQLPALNASVADTVESIYGDLREKAKKLVLDHFTEKMAQAEHLVNQSAAVAQKEEEEKTQIRNVVEQARRVLQDVTSYA